MIVNNVVEPNSDGSDNDSKGGEDEDVELDVVDFYDDVKGWNLAYETDTDVIESDHLSCILYIYFLFFH